MMKMGICYFTQLVREDPSDKVTYKQRPEGSERKRHVDIWGGHLGEGSLCRKNSMCKGPEVGAYLFYFILFFFFMKQQ